MRDPQNRMRALLKMIEEWEDNPEPEMTKEWIEAAEDAEELIFDIKQCLESLVRDYEISWKAK